MLRTALILIALTATSFAQDATWMNLADEGWCYYPTASQTAETAPSSTRPHCLSSSFNLRNVDTNYLYFVYEDEDHPSVHLTFEGGASAAQKSVAHRVLSGLEFQREYWEGDLRLLRFGPSDSEDQNNNLHQAYVEFPNGAVVVIWSSSLESVEFAIGDLLD